MGGQNIENKKNVRRRAMMFDKIIRKLLNSHDIVRWKGEGLKRERWNTNLENQISNIRIKDKGEETEEGIACG
jgi:hypothetical protein